MKLTLEELEQMVLDEMYKKYSGGPLGKWVFPKDLTGKLRLQHPDAKKEKDTPLEKVLSRYLSAHVGRNKPLPNDVIRKMKKLIYAGYYPEIFKFYNKGTVYRGMNLSKEFIEMNFGALPEKPVWYKAPIDWWNTRADKEVDYTFQTKTKHNKSKKQWWGNKEWSKHAKSKASSWTDDLQSAKSFAGDNEDGYAIVLVAEASQNRDVFIDLDPLYKAFDLYSGFEGENELIATDDVKVSSIIWHYLA